MTKVSGRLSDRGRMRRASATWFYYGCPDVDAAYAKLQAAGVTGTPPKVTMYGGTNGFRALSFRDPDGRGITLQWPELAAR